MRTRDAQKVLERKVHTQEDLIRDLRFKIQVAQGKLMGLLDALEILKSPEVTGKDPPNTKAPEHPRRSDEPGRTKSSLEKGAIA